MTKKIKAKLRMRARDIFNQQKRRNTVAYTMEEFISWWIRNYTSKKWKRAHCGRIDHNKGYAFSNIVMQEQRDNNIERNNRRGNPCKSHRKVTDGKNIFVSKRDAAAFYGCNEKTIYNHCMNKLSTKKALFKWA